MDYDNLDQGVVNLARAVRQQESAGGVRTTSRLATQEGSVGAFQYLKPTFERQARLLGGRDLNGNPLDINNDEHQNLVFYTWAKNLKDQGYGVDQIAAAHNGGEGALKDYQKRVGVNKYGNSYNVPKYVNSVLGFYNALKQNQVSEEPQYQEPQEPTIEELRAERQAQGLPVAVNPNKVEPNLFSNIVRGVIKPFASVAVGTEKAVGSLAGAITGNDEMLLANDPTKAVKSKFLGDIYPMAYDKEGLNIKKGIGQLAEIASVGVGGGTLGSVAQIGKQVFKEGAKAALKASVPLIKEGAVSGALGGFGSAMSADKNFGQIVGDTALGGVIGGVATPVLAGAGALIGKGASKVAGQFDDAAKQAKIKQNVMNELLDIENNYSKLRKNQTYNKTLDESRKRVIDSGVLNNVVDETGTIRTTDAIREYRDLYGVTGQEGVVRDNLAMLGETINATELEDTLIQKLLKSNIKGKELQTAFNNIKDEVAGFKLSANSDEIPLTLLHDAKIYVADKVGDFATPITDKTYAKTLARALKETIEDKSAFNVKEVNKKLSEPLSDIEYLLSLDGRKVRGGKLGKYAAQISGNIIGGAAGSVLGPVGSAVGTVVGGETASAIKGSMLSKSLTGVKGAIPTKSKVIKEAVKKSAPLRKARELEKSYSNSLGNLNTIYPNMITKKTNVIPKVSTELPKKASIPVKTKTRIISEEAYQKATENMRKAGNQINSGIPVNQMKDALVIAGYHIENGVRTAVELGEKLAKEGYEFTKEQIDELFNNVKVKNSIKSKIDEFGVEPGEESYLYSKLSDEEKRIVRTHEGSGIEEKIKNYLNNNNLISKSHESYKMSHRPTETGAIASDITNNGELIPKDFYTNPEYYANLRDKTYKESLAQIMKVKGKPDAEITIYRASPKKELNNGDWITLSKSYAKQESLSEGTQVHAFKVKAKDIQFAGDDINEFGYYPNKK